MGSSSSLSAQSSCSLPEQDLHKQEKHCDNTDDEKRLSDSDLMPPPKTIASAEEFERGLNSGCIHLSLPHCNSLWRNNNARYSGETRNEDEGGDIQIHLHNNQYFVTCDGIKYYVQKDKQRLQNPQRQHQQQELFLLKQSIDNDHDSDCALKRKAYNCDNHASDNCKSQKKLLIQDSHNCSVKGHQIWSEEIICDPTTSKTITITTMETINIPEQCASSKSTPIRAAEAMTDARCFETLNHSDNNLIGRVTGDTRHNQSDEKTTNDEELIFTNATEDRGDMIQELDQRQRQRHEHQEHQREEQQRRQDQHEQHRQHNQKQLKMLRHQSKQIERLNRRRGKQSQYQQQQEELEQCEVPDVEQIFNSTDINSNIDSKNHQRCLPVEIEATEKKGSQDKTKEDSPGGNGVEEKETNETFGGSGENTIAADVSESSSSSNALPSLIERSQELQQGRHRPASQKSQQQLCPDIHFRDIIGHGAAKLRMEEVLLPIALPSGMADSILTGIRSLPASILLHGPPGCGKTQLARAIAGEAQAAFLPVGPSDILSKFVGESEASIRGIFDNAYETAKKMESRCAILFFDEIDAIGQSRGGGGNTPAQSGSGDSCSRRVLAELLIQLNRMSQSPNSATMSSPKAVTSTIKPITNVVGTTASARETMMVPHHDQRDVRNPATLPVQREEFVGNHFCNNNHNQMKLQNQNQNQNQNDEKYLSDTESSCCSRYTEESNNSDEEIVMLSERPMAITCNGNPITQDEDEQDLPGEQKGFNDETNAEETSYEQARVRVIVVAATNRPEDCDPALLRRFGIRVNVGFPSQRHRKKILSRLLSQVSHKVSKRELNDLATVTEGWSGSDLESLTREAVMAPLRECIRTASLSKRRALRDTERRQPQQTRQQRQRQQKRQQRQRQEQEEKGRQGELGKVIANTSTQFGVENNVDARQRMEQEQQQTDPYLEARESLLAGLKSLRPVTLDDFDAAIDWMGNQHNGAVGNLGDSPEEKGSRTVHYDTSSSSEDEE